jgi:hypothetical protein
MHHVIPEFVNLFCTGLLAGAELVVRYGVRAPIAVLDEQPQIQLRQALIRSLRVLVPAILAPTVVSGVAVTALDGTGPGFGLRCTALLALLAWALVTFIGTVPINKATLTWLPGAPPGSWRALVSRWERLDTARSWAALAAFAFFLTATALPLA